MEDIPEADDEEEAGPVQELTQPGVTPQYDDWEVVAEIQGRGQAEVVRGLLEANGIPVVLSQEGAGEYAYPVNVGPLGLVQVLTPVELRQEVLELLAPFELSAPEDDE